MAAPRGASLGGAGQPGLGEAEMGVKWGQSLTPQLIGDDAAPLLFSTLTLAFYAAQAGTQGGGGGRADALKARTREPGAGRGRLSTPPPLVQGIKKRKRGSS